MRSLLVLVVFVVTCAPAFAQRAAPIDMGTIEIVGTPRRGVTLDPRAPRTAPTLETRQRPDDLVRKSFRRALLGTASRL